MKHKIIIPGLDRELCGNCRQWVCRQCELDRLKQDLDKAKATKKPKKETLDRLKTDYKLEVALSENCPGVKPNLSQSKKATPETPTQTSLQL